MNSSPRTSRQKYAYHSRRFGRQHIIVQPVANIGDLCRRDSGDFRDADKKLGRWFLDTPFFRGPNEIQRGMHMAQRFCEVGEVISRNSGLIAGGLQLPKTRDHVRIELVGTKW